MARTTISVIYGGKRMSTTGRLTNAWLRDATDDEPMLFDKLNGTAIGCRYNVEVEQNGDGTLSAYIGTLSFDGDWEPVDDLDVTQLQALDAAARHRKSQNDAERRASKRSDLDELIEPLREQYSKIRTGADRRAFLDVIAEKISRPIR